MSHFQWLSYIVHSSSSEFLSICVINNLYNCCQIDWQGFSRLLFILLEIVLYFSYELFSKNCQNLLKTFSNWIMSQSSVIYWWIIDHWFWSDYLCIEQVRFGSRTGTVAWRRILASPLQIQNFFSYLSSYFTYFYMTRNQLFQTTIAWKNYEVVQEKMRTKDEGDFIELLMESSFQLWILFKYLYKYLPITSIEMK